MLVSGKLSELSLLSSLISFFSSFFIEWIHSFKFIDTSPTVLAAFLTSCLLNFPRVKFEDVLHKTVSLEIVLSTIPRAFL